MNISPIALKEQARETIRSSKPSVISVGAVFLILGVVIGLLSSKLIYGDFSQSELQTYMEYVVSEDYEAALEMINDSAPSAAASLLDSVLNFLLSVVSVGFTIFLLNTIRCAQPCYGNLLDGFGMIWRILVLFILEGIFIALWSLLLIIPGIVATYKYSQALYLLIDHPELSPMDCIRKSKAMMMGHKGELFMIHLSFLIWGILCIIPYLGYAVRIWAVPYYRTANALYYERISDASYYEKMRNVFTQEDSEDTE